MKKKLPPLKTNKTLERLLEGDMSDYLDTDNFKPVRFEFLAKDEKINLRVPASMLSELKKRAKKSSLPYQRYIRTILEKELTRPTP